MAAYFVNSKVSGSEIAQYATHNTQHTAITQRRSGQAGTEGPGMIEGRSVAAGRPFSVLQDPHRSRANAIWRAIQSLAR